MRNLVLLRGCPASGKSTFIKENNLHQYTLCADEIRLLFQTPVLTTEGNLAISMKNDKKVWDLLFQCLEERMKRGEFTIIDATHSKSSDFTKYKKLAEQYRYRMWCIDFTDVSIEVAKERNRLRESYKFVPENVIENIYSRFATQTVPTYVTLIKPQEFRNTFQFKSIDLSHYNKIHHIGDLHGCNTVLQEYLNGELKENEFYIFCGDYIDRGIENAELLKFLFSIMDNKNVIFLNGNHEEWIWNWANDLPTKSKEFRDVTQKQLEYYGINKKDCRQFYRKLRQLAYYTYNEKEVIVTHGGLSTMPDNLMYVATEQLIKGVGNYEDNIDTTFINSTNNIYQIHGHRNIYSLPIKVNERCFNLEGQVEFGKHLRIATLDKEDFKTFEIKNNIFNNERFDKKVQNIEVNIDNKQFVDMLKSNENIYERKLCNNISSFNFKNKVFYDGLWNEQTIKARGLFINVNTCNIATRSYEKFFNISERPETELPALKNTLQYPVNAYVKYNGYLGLVGYNDEFDELFISSKSSDEGNFAQWLREIFFNKINRQQEDEIKQYLKDNNCSLVFEVINPIDDPHMIKYNDKNLVLLDIVYREINYRKMSYEKVINFANKYNFKYKELAYTLNSWEEFYDWYNKVITDNWQYNEEYIEGFVIEDTNGFMTKIKLQYYKFWKHMRSVKEAILKNQHNKIMGSLQTPLANEFVGWLRQQSQNIIRKDIITLREMFYNESK